LDLAGTPEEQSLAQEVFALMRMQGVTMSARANIRQSLENLAQFFAEEKYKGLDDIDALATIIDKALSANPAVFLREENEEGQVTFKTTKLGIAPTPGPVVYDHHSFKTRLFEGAKAVVPMSDEELHAKAVDVPARQETSSTFALPLPFAAEPKTANAEQKIAAKEPVVAPKPVEAKPLVVEPVVAPKPVEAKPPVIEPVAPPKPIEAKPPVIEPVAPPKPIEAKPPVVEPIAPPKPIAAPAGPVIVTLEEGVEVDLSKSASEILDTYGNYFSSALATSLNQDLRFINFANDWFLEDQTERLTKGDFRRIRDYMNEVGGPVTDTAILTDVFNKRNNDQDYEAKRFSLNFRLSREKKDFEFVGAEDDRIWTAPGMNALGPGKRKASEIGLDYKFLEDTNLNDPIVLNTVKGRKQWDHTITFYEYENGLLPYDLNARSLFPSGLLEEQKLVILRLEAPQLEFTYTAELHFPSGTRGGWIAGLEDFYANNLIPGAKLLVTQGIRTNHFIIEYEVSSAEQERRLLFYDERRQKFVYRTIGFECQVNENEILTPERFSKLDNQKRLEESDRKKTDFLVASAFELVGVKQADLLRAPLNDLYPLINIERPFSRAYLRNLLSSGNSAFRADPNDPEYFTYRIGGVKK
jgi:hypothetical protein